MSGDALLQQLAGGTSEVCRVWTIRRRDGLVLGFTDHDRALEFQGVNCRADSGLSAAALQQASGLAVDNTEAIGALSGSAITEADLNAGRYDGAEVRIWLVSWQDPSVGREMFRGTLGEVSYRGAQFRVELRGQTEPLNQVAGFAYTRACSAVLGDARCGFDVTQPGYQVERVVERVESGAVFTFDWAQDFDDRWFEGGRLEVLSGPAMGLTAMIRADRQIGTTRRVELWQSIRAEIEPGDVLRLTAGCNKRDKTCRDKFVNFSNFRGFPHLPGEDWLTATDSSGG